VTIDALEVSVIGLVEFSGVNNMIRVHPFPDLMADPLVEIGKITVAMAHQAFLVFLYVSGGDVVILGHQ
jgi:hypothetical protein